MRVLELDAPIRDISHLLISRLLLVQLCVQLGNISTVHRSLEQILVEHVSIFLSCLALILDPIRALAEFSLGG